MNRCAVALCLILAPAAVAHEVTVEDYFGLASVNEVAVSPDGKAVAYCEARWDKKANDRKADLWLLGTAGRPTRLTSDRANDRSPRWSADGKWIYVLANRKRAGEKAPYDGKTQVWRVPAAGGEPKAVTKAEAGVSHFDLAAGADALFYSTDTKRTDDGDFAELRREFAQLDYGHGSRQVSEVWRLDLGDWRERRVFAEGKYVRELAVTEQGDRLALLTARDDSVVESEGRAFVEVWEANTGKLGATDEGWRMTAASPYPWLESLAWSPSGEKLAYVAVFDAYPAEVIVNEWKDGKPKAERLKRPDGVHVRGYGSPLRWADEKAPIHLMEKAGEVWLSSDRPSGTVALAFDVRKGATAMVRGSAGKFPRLVVTREGREERQSLDVNAHTSEWKLPSVKHVTWKSGDVSVGGVLELPPGYEKGKKLPLVVALHGGPTTSVKANLEFNPYDGRLFLSTRGYAVLCPNYRGSTGYGDKFVTDLVGRENDLDVKDILSGIDHLVKEGIADPKRVAVMGWSNGGYLTNCLITMKDCPYELKAASSGAGILDCVAEWGFNDEPAYPFVFKKGTPWQQPELYRKTSPTYGLGNAKTPTLIHVGANDERCPPGHSRMLYRALKEYNKVPTQLVVYPGEPHGLGRYDSRLAKMRWDVAWFDKYVLGR